jgi:DNA repair protein RadC
MYDLARLEQNPFMRAMLWQPDQLVSALYELRNRGLLSKISEIDSVRQFTTRLTLRQVIERLVAGEFER